MEMDDSKRNVLLVSMPFAGVTIPSIQLPILEGYLKERNVDVKTRHLYLKVAEFYELKNYDFLSNTSGVSYAAQMIFSKYVFPEHFKENIEKFREYFNKIKLTNTENKLNLGWDEYIRCTDEFYNWVIENIEWRKYDIIGFTLNYGQFLPSLAIAKKIKELDSGKKIIFGGSRTVGKLGVKVLESFNFVDFIVSGDGEEPLYRLTSDYQNYMSIPGLIYRVEKDVIWNKSDVQVDLNILPILNFDPFYEDLSLTSNELQKHFHLNGRLPVEISRGCWWNKCTFCNLNLQYNCYREKNVDKILEEIKFLSDKYQMLNFHIVGNTLPKSNYKYLIEEIKKIGRRFSFFVETRAGTLKSMDYKLLAEAGFSGMQTGIESFSTNYLKKMNKGVRVIDNIATLKHCKENGIRNDYNIIINYPNENGVDFEETKENIQLFKQYLAPPYIGKLIIGFGSPIYNNLESFNIEKLDYTDIDKIMFPVEFLQKEFNFYYSYTRKENLGENDWEQLIKDWKNEHEKFVKEAFKKNSILNRFIFYFVDGKKFLKIYDKRNFDDTRVYILDEYEREVFLSCIDVISFQKLSEKYSSLSVKQLTSILQALKSKGIIFEEDNNYLSLPLLY
jgi:ribosomal peptide maturation radical SAM protein 1